MIVCLITKAILGYATALLPMGLLPLLGVLQVKDVAA